MLSRIYRFARLVNRAKRYEFKLDPAEIAFARQSSPLGGVAIDLGAHKGGYTFHIARAVGRQGRVIAIEAQPNLAERLADTIRLMPQVEVVHAAISDRVGEALLSVRPGETTHGASIAGFASGPVGGTLAVPTTTLAALVDRFSLDRVDFIKCDVEGHELAVIGGSLDVLDRFAPKVLIECEERHQKPDEEISSGSRVATLAEIVGQIGYRVRFFLGGQLRPIEEFDADTHQNYGVGEYCNNFVLDRPA